MSKLVRLACLAIASGWCVVAPAEAQACVFLGTTYVGLTDAEIEQSKREDAERERLAAMARQAQFREDVLAGRIDSADGLAELLVPNVREWWEDRSDCGPTSDGDGPPMPVAYLVAQAFVGTELEGVDQDALLDHVYRFARDYVHAHSKACNVEFRARFAARVRRDVPPDERAAAYLLLTRSGTVRVRYYEFADAQRTVPVLERWPHELTDLLDRPDAAGIRQAIADFWSEALPQLSDESLTCPKAHEDMLAARDEELARVRPFASHARLVRTAASRAE